MWRWRIYNMILGYDKLSEGDVGSHQACRLGSWCEVTDHCEEIQSFVNQLSGPHKRFHDLGELTIREYNRGNIGRSKEILEELEVASNEVIKILRKLKKVKK